MLRRLDHYLVRGFQMPCTSKLSIVAIVAVASACAAAGASRTSGGSRDLITQEEIAETPYDNAYDIVSRLRPSWIRFRGRGAVPVSYMDDLRLGDPTQLQRVYRDQIQEIRFISGPDATTRWGTDHGGGVIQVIQKR